MKQERVEEGEGRKRGERKITPEFQLDSRERKK